MRRRRLFGVLVVGLLLVAVTLAAAGLASRRAASAPSFSGTWRRAANEIDAGGPTVFHLHQVGARLTGSIPWRGCTSKEGGIGVGFVVGKNAVLAFKQTDGSLVLQHMQLAADGKSVTGGWNVTAGTCAGSSGPFDATRVG